MDTKKAVDHLFDSAEKDWNVARSLFRLKHYAYSLFFCHLAVEKLLKALVIQRKNRIPPPIHDLKKLAKLAGMKLTPIQRDRLETITTFNIKARYDDVKQSFYRQATREYAKEHLELSKEIYSWLRETLLSEKS